MPKFILKLKVTNNSGVSVSAHVGASLIGTQNQIEYYNTADDIKKLFPTGDTIVQRYLNTDLGTNQKYDLVVALWEGEKTIGKGIKYASFTVKSAYLIPFPIFFSPSQRATTRSYFSFLPKSV